MSENHPVRTVFDHVTGKHGAQVAYKNEGLIWDRYFWSGYKFSTANDAFEAGQWVALQFEMGVLAV